MMGGPWAGRLGILFILIIVVKASPSLAEFLVALAFVASAALLLYKGRYFPRVIMDILDRLTNKAQLERAYETKDAQLTTINAEELAAKLKAKVIGQNEVIDEIAAQLRRRIAAKRKDKPLAVLCFAGPPGVGKTHLAKVLAETLYADKNHLHFFDMSQAATPMGANALFGSPKGYIGSTSYGALTAALRDVPNAVVLLDEFEKAHPEVHKRFLTAWNDGFVTELSDGAKLPTNEAIFILTTNAASRRIGEMASQHSGPRGELDRMVKSALADAQFAPEVLSRIDEVFAFRDLKGLDIARVVALEIEALAQQFGLEIAAGGIEPRILLSAIDTLSKQQPAGGVRDIARTIEKQITDGLIDAKAERAKRIRLQADGERIRVVPESDGPTTQQTGDSSAGLAQAT
jgi:ATP-dependent Clp protease ATP-binding subunit ClpA